MTTQKVRTDENTYNLPLDDAQNAMLNEPMAAYSATTSQNHIVITVPQGVNAEPLRQKIKILLQETLLEQKCQEALKEWLDCTCMYSGPNLCWDNEPFRQIQSMGPQIIPLIDKAIDQYPDYTHRHLRWLKRKLTE